MVLEESVYTTLYFEEYWNYAYDVMRKRKYTNNQDKFNDEVKLNLLSIYLEMLSVYYRETVSDDENLFTVTEIKDIIDTFNDLAGSFITYDERIYIEEDLEYFITEWKLPSGRFTFPALDTGTYNAEINFGDDNTWYPVTTFDSSNLTHVYTEEGTRKITVRGTFPHFGTLNSTYAENLRRILQWGNVGFESAAYMCLGCTQLRSLPSFNLYDSFSNCTNFASAWNGCWRLLSFPSINVSSGTNFNKAWRKCYSLEFFPYLNLSNNLNYTSTWESCQSLKSFPEIDINAAVVSLTNTWSSCSNLVEFPLLDISNVTSLKSTWTDCYQLISFPRLDVSSCTNFTSTWEGCYRLTSMYLGSWATGITSLRATWKGCTLLGYISNIENIDITSLSTTDSAKEMLNGVTLTPTNYSNLLIGWDAQAYPLNGTLDGGYSRYYGSGDAPTAKARMEADGWTITDLGVW
jgi:hypothetical protein